MIGAFVGTCTGTFLDFIVFFGADVGTGAEMFTGVGTGTEIFVGADMGTFTGAFIDIFDGALTGDETRTERGIGTGTGTGAGTGTG